MNHTIREARSFCETIDEANSLAMAKDIILGVCPSYLCLNTVRRRTPKNFVVAAQDIHPKASGAYTGAVSVSMLEEIDIRWSLVGHSERRTYEHDTNEFCNQKILALLDNLHTPVYCVGETLDQYEKGITKAVVKNQLVEGLKDVSEEDMAKIVIAYEPVWSIGTGKNASSEIAEDVCAFIREVITELYSDTVAEKVSILYGGSVKPENIHEYMQTGNIDGALVGGASLSPESFFDLVQNF